MAEQTVPWWRHAVSIVLLPVTVVVIVPAWITRSVTFGDVWTNRAVMVAGMTLGTMLFALGFAVFASRVAVFGRVGRGTLAPWDPAQRMVAVGPYRYVRNPMIVSVAGMLVGEALLLGSVPLAAWSAAFIVINHIYFVLAEEPGLERRFGETYLEYKRRVPRWLPRRPRG